MNNSLVASTSYTGTAISGQDGIRLMRRWDNDEYWGGKLGIVNVYKGSLSAGLINSSWNANKARFGL